MNGNWIQQTSTTEGTGALTLDSVSGYPTFASQFAVNEPLDYVILNADKTPIERGIGSLDGSGNLVRGVVMAIYSAGTYVGANPSAVSLAAGTKTVICAAGAHSTVATRPGVWANTGGKCYGGTAIVTAYGTTALVADRAYAVPFRAAVDRDIDGVFFRVSLAGAAGKLAKCAIFAHGSDGLPGPVLATGTSVAVDTTGLKVSTFTRFRPPPVFFVGLLSDGTPTINTSSAGVPVSEIMGIDTTIVGAGFIHHVGATGLTFPTGWTPVANGPTIGVPMLLARVQ